MIQVDGLAKYFGSVKAVDGISFGVEKGEIVGFLGPNGAGKTTTMRILTCFIPPSGGRATVAGFDVMKQSVDVRCHVGYLPESVPLYPEMRVREYVDFRAKLKGVPRKDRTKKVDEVMTRCRIRDVQRKLIGTLSRGYRQRVGLAESMVHDPEILVLDEPTVGLDPIQIRETRKLIKELGEQHTILLSTHILHEVEMVCERVIIIARGRIALSDTLKNLQAGAIIGLEVRGPAAKVRSAIEVIDGIASVEFRESPQDGIATFDIRTHNDADLRETISQRVTQNGWIIRGLEVRRRTLEDHFISAALSVEEREA
jgi:gliding motility-associated transport system ATP-binding protein